jgi:acylphosphatase
VTDSEIQAKRYFVSGSVQGVGFRYFTQGEAERLKLSGFVRNVSDGRVEVYAMGSPTQLSALRRALERGSRFANVTEVREEPARIEAQFSGQFLITH